MENRINTLQTDSLFWIKEQSLYQDHPVIWQGYKNFTMGIQKLEKDGADEAKSLHKAKSTGKSEDGDRVYTIIGS